MLGSDRKHYRVLDLDFRERKGKREGGEDKRVEEDSDESGSGSDIEMMG